MYTEAVEEAHRNVLRIGLGLSETSSKTGSEMMCSSGQLIEETVHSTRSKTKQMAFSVSLDQGLSVSPN
jgi:hypothetical protein